jgi:hypothetical protein
MLQIQRQAAFRMIKPDDAVVLVTVPAQSRLYLAASYMRPRGEHHPVLLGFASQRVAKAVVKGMQDPKGPRHYITVPARHAAATAFHMLGMDLVVVHAPPQGDEWDVGYLQRLSSSWEF